MRCPFCDSDDTQVLESRSVDDGHSLRRRRECGKCKKRFTTYETVKGSVLWVIKKNGRREPFEKEKIKKGVLRAIEKRPVSLSKVDTIIDQVEREMLRKQKEEIPSPMIGRAVLKRLKRLDEVAWLRFASVYMEFGDLGDFENIIKR